VPTSTSVTSGSEVPLEPVGACSVGNWTDSGLLAINVNWDEEDFELSVFDLSSRVIHRLTDNGVVDRWPKWSPDGKKILFFSDRYGDDYELFVLDYDSGDLSQLTDNDTHDAFASWSPDGLEIVFASQRDGDWEIFLANADGTNVRQITHNEVDDHTPVWSSSLDLIAFNSYRTDGYRMWLMNGDGSSQEMINIEESPGFPVWSGDGTKIAFNSATEGTRAVGILDPVGNDPIRIMPVEGGWPVWLEDDRRIAFSSPKCGGVWQIFLANSDGTDVVATGVPGSPISWRP
jgi:Tol biopolymer transport system component